MRKLFLLIALLGACGCAWAAEAPAAAELSLSEIELTGEVATPGKVNLDVLPLRSVIVREAVLENGTPRFVGAYRYDGYALADILAGVTVAKKNAKEFPPPVDLLVRIENAAGASVLLSWGEITYTAKPYRILIARRATPIVPAKTGKIGPIPTESKLVCGDDRYAFRSLAQPTRITVFACPQSFDVDRDKKTSPKITLLLGQEKKGEVKELPPAAERRTCPVTYFGHGMGFHGFRSFQGVLLREVVGGHWQPDAAAFRQGYLVLVGADGYRVTYSVSELWNRADADEPLLIDRGKEEDGGRFASFAAADFYADRSVRCLEKIVLVPAP